MGFLIYFMVDNTTIITSWIYSIIDIDKPLVTINGTVGMHIRNYGLDLIWAYSMWFCVYYVGFAFKHRIAFAGIITILFGMLLEIMQLINIISGTADYLDVIYETLGVLIAIVVYIIGRVEGGNRNE